MSHFDYWTMLLFVLPAFGIGWLCGWLWAKRPGAEDVSALAPPDLADGLLGRIAGATEAEVDPGGVRAGDDSET